VIVCGNICAGYFVVIILPKFVSVCVIAQSEENHNRVAEFFVDFQVCSDFKVASSNGSVCTAL